MLLACRYEFKPPPISVAFLHTCGYQVPNPAYFFSNKEAAAMKTSCFHLFIFLAKHWGRESKLEASSFFHCSWWRVVKEGHRRIMQGFLFTRD